MHRYGTATLAHLLGDLIAYRSLCPCERRLPTRSDVAAALGLPPDMTPRKGDESYARMVAEQLRAARRLSAPAHPLRRIILIGDTLKSDGGALTGLCAVTGWQGQAFICQERADAPPAIVRTGAITNANHWSSIRSFAAQLDADDFAIDTATAIILDIDKTLLGARGRNDHVIDTARLHALRESVATLLGTHFDPDTFAETYRTLDQTHLHPLTSDNQDYVALICLIIGAGVITCAEVCERFAKGQLPNFATFLALTHPRIDSTAPDLVPFFTDITHLIAAGDPTPFKAFRRREYTETIACMGDQADMTPEHILREKLVITGEVWNLAQTWRTQGALLFGLSDKPDEAALPDPTAQASGALPLHRIKTAIIGSSPP